MVEQIVPPFKNINLYKNDHLAPVDFKMDGKSKNRARIVNLHITSVIMLTSVIPSILLLL
jgi:hypothetical protein